MTEQVQKKDLTQEQIEVLLQKEFSKTQDWQFILYLLIMVVPFTLLFLWGFSDLSIWFRLPVYVLIGITLWKCERWVVARRIRKTIEAMRVL